MTVAPADRLPTAPGPHLGQMTRSEHCHRAIIKTPEALSDRRALASDMMSPVELLTGV